MTKKSWHPTPKKFLEFTKKTYDEAKNIEVDWTKGIIIEGTDRIIFDKMVQILHYILDKKGNIHE